MWPQWWLTCILHINYHTSIAINKLGGQTPNSHWATVVVYKLVAYIIFTLQIYKITSFQNIILHFVDVSTWYEPSRNILSKIKFLWLHIIILAIKIQIGLKQAIQLLNFAMWFMLILFQVLLWALSSCQNVCVAQYGMTELKSTKENWYY